MTLRPLRRCLETSATLRGRHRVAPLLLCLSLLPGPTTGASPGGASLLLSNFEPGVIDARVVDSDGTSPLPDNMFMAELFVSPNADPGSMVALGPGAPFRTGAQAGYIIPVTRDIPVPIGTEVWAQIRVWEISCGNSFEQALSNTTPGCRLGFSTPIRVRVENPGLLAGLQSFSVETDLHPVTITQHPADRAARENESITLEVIAEGTPPLSYQWFNELGPIPGATSAILSIAPVLPHHAGVYRAEVRNGFSSQVSAPATLSISGPPRIVSQPLSKEVDPGTSVTLTVEATGTPPLLFQWRKNGLNLPLQTNNSSLVIPSATIEDGAVYEVIVANESGAQLSQPAFLTLNIPQLPIADAFTNAVILPGDQGSFRGQNLGTTLEPREPRHASLPAGSSVWFQFIPTADGILTIHTRGSSFDTLLAAYRGDQIDTLQELAGDSDSGGFNTSQIQFNVQHAQPCLIAVAGRGGAQGIFILNWELEPTTDLLPVIAIHPQSITVPPGTPAQLSVQAPGTDLIYAWFFRGEPLLNQTGPVLPLNPVTPDNVGRYQAAVRRGSREVRSRIAVIEIGSNPEIRSHDKIADLAPQPLPPSPGEGGTGGGGFPGFVPVSSGTINSHLLDTTESGTEPGEGPPCGIIGGASQWFGLTATENGVIAIDTIGSNYDTVMSVYTGPATYTPAFLLFLNLVNCDNNGAPDGIRSELCFPAIAGEHYYVAVDGVGGAGGTAQLNWRMIQPETEGAGAAKILVMQGRDVGLTFPLPPDASSIQWYHDNTALPGGAQETICICNAQFPDGGEYSAITMEPAGPVTNWVRKVVVATMDHLLTPINFTVTTEATDVVFLQQSDDMSGWINIQTNPAPLNSLPYIDSPLVPIRYFRLTPEP